MPPRRPTPWWWARRCRPPPTGSPAPRPSPPTCGRSTHCTGQRHCGSCSGAPPGSRAAGARAATTATDPVVRATDVRAALRGRPARPLLIIDLGVPRDVESAVASLPGVTYVDLDGLTAAVEGTLQSQEAEVAAASALVEERLQALGQWLAAREVQDVVAQLHRQSETIRQEVLQKYRSQFPPELWPKVEGIAAGREGRGRE